MRWAVAAGAAAAVFSAGLLLSAGAYLAVLGAVLLATMASVGLLVQVGRPYVGLAVLLATAVAFPLEFRGPSASWVSSSLPLAAFVCVAWVLSFALPRRSVPLERSRVVYAVMAFMGTTMLSFAMGQFPWFPSGGAPLPAQIAELAIFLVSGCIFLAVGHQLDALRQVKALTWIFIAAGTVAAVVQTVPGLAVIGRLTTRPGSVGSLFWIWLVAITTGQALFNRSMPVAARAGLLGIAGLVFFHGLVQVPSWSSGWLPPLGAFGFILLLRFPRLSAAGAVLIVPIALFLSDNISAWLLGHEETSLSTRLVAWETLWPLVERSPLLGTGPANYYYFTENFPILGWYVRFVSHNNYQDLLVQTGFLGLLAFCWMALEMLGMSIRAHRAAVPGFVRGYTAGALGGLIGSLVAGMLGDWIVPFYYNGGILGFRSSVLFWLFLGGVLALRRMELRTNEAQAFASWPAPVYGGSVRQLQAAR